VRELAAFASSEAGKAFARIEQHFGRDPAASLEDDVLAHNLRAALLMTLAEDEMEIQREIQRAEAAGDRAVEQARAAGARIRERMNG
jgi:N-acyl-D-aspartate/D-glutamate deacylase